ncbi:F-box family protein [Euphorbia peplus]|nr:F-box family protein [Euphorbia peplus]
MNDSSNIIMPKANYIPDGIVPDILSKLPSRSVLRFKIACKIWYSLISDPVFINLHSKRASQNPKLLFSTANFKRLQLLDYESSLFDVSCLTRLSCPINFQYAKIVGSSCGLVCINTDIQGNNFSIFNPLTGKCREIPKLFFHDSVYDQIFHGLGYDSVANDFKLLTWMFGKPACHIFSLKTNSWKTIAYPLVSQFYGFVPRNTIPTIVNGIFYWLVTLFNGDYGLVTFDVSNETFQYLQLPEHLLRYYVRGAGLLEHIGHLCLSFTGYRLKHEKEIWMMKHGGWVHLFTIKNSPMFECSHLHVVCVSTSNEIIFRGTTRFSRCGKEEEDEFDEIHIKQDGVEVLYVETLVSPNVEDWANCD